MRSFGVGSVRVGSASMAPTIQTGERLVTLSPRKARRGSLVLLYSPVYSVRSRFFPVKAENSPWIIRTVAAAPGDTVVLRASDVLVFTPLDERIVIENASTVPEELFPGERQYHLREGEIFVLADDDRYVDSREWGPVPTSSIFGRVILRYWPFSRYTFFSHR